MASDQNREEAVKQSLTLLQQLRSTDIPKLARTEQLGEAFTFKAVLPSVQRIVDLYGLVNPDALPRLSKTLRDEFNSRLQTDLNTIQKIRNFQANAPDSANQHLAVMREVEKNYDQSFGVVLHVISLSAAINSDLGEIRQRTEQRFDEAVSKIQSTVQGTVRLAEEAKAALATIKETAGKAGVSSQANHFQSESAVHEGAAHRWLIAVILLGVALLLYSISTIFLHRLGWLAPTTVYEAVQLGVSKALVFTSLAYGVLLAARNYTASRHNVVVNRHRHNALAVYQALVAAAIEESTRDAILNKAAECIFSPQPTAFGKPESNEPPSISLVTMASPLPKQTTNPN